MSWISDVKVFLYLDPDNKHQKLIDVYRSCKNTQIKVPKILREYFCNEDPGNVCKINVGSAIPSFVEPDLEFFVRAGNELLIMPFVLSRAEILEFSFSAFFTVSEEGLPCDIKAILGGINRYRNFVKIDEMCEKAAVDSPEEVANFLSKKIVSVFDCLLISETKFDSSSYGYEGCVNVNIVPASNRERKFIFKIDLTKLPAGTKTLHIKWGEK